MDKSETVTCFRCRMTFDVEEPYYTDTEYTRCAEDGCDLRFWHVGNSGSRGPRPKYAKVGIHPADAAAS